MIFGPVSGSDRNSAPAFASDSSSTAFAAIDLEAVDDEDVVDGPRVEHHAAAVGERRELQHRDHREVEPQALLLRVEDDERDQRADDDVDADEEQDQRVAAHRREIVLRIPDDEHQRDDGRADRRAEREVQRRGFPAIE